MDTTTPKQGFIARWLASRPEVRRVARGGVHYRLVRWPDGRQRVTVEKVDRAFPAERFDELWCEAAEDAIG